jgi:hypothetical protein
LGSSVSFGAEAGADALGAGFAAVLGDAFAADFAVEEVLFLVAMCIPLIGSMVLAAQRARHLPWDGRSHPFHCT